MFKSTEESFTYKTSLKSKLSGADTIEKINNELHHEKGWRYRHHLDFISQHFIGEYDNEEFKMMLRATANGSSRNFIPSNAVISLKINGSIHPTDIDIDISIKSITLLIKFFRFMFLGFYFALLLILLFSSESLGSKLFVTVGVISFNIIILSYKRCMKKIFDEDVNETLRILREVLGENNI